MGALSFPVWHATLVRLATRNENGFHYIVSRSQSVINNMNGTKVPDNSNEIDLSSAHTHTHQINYLMELPNALPSQTHTHTQTLLYTKEVKRNHTYHHSHAWCAYGVQLGYRSLVCVRLNVIDVKNENSTQRGIYPRYLAHLNHRTRRLDKFNWKWCHVFWMGMFSTERQFREILTFVWVKTHFHACKHPG